MTGGKGPCRWQKWAQSRAEREQRVGGTWSQLNYLVSPVSCEISGQPLATSSLSVLICVVGAMIPGPLGSGED